MACVVSSAYNESKQDISVTLTGGAIADPSNTPASAGTLLTGVCGDATGIADAEFTISIDGDAQDITGIDLSLAASLADVAAAIQTALQAVGTGGFAAATCAVSGGTRLLITSGTVGAASAVSAMSAVSGGVGTDISATLEAQSDDDITITAGAAPSAGDMSLIIGANVYTALLSQGVERLSAIENLVDAYRETGNPLPVNGEFVVVYGTPTATVDGMDLLKKDITVVTDSADVTAQITDDVIGIAVASGFSGRSGKTYGPGQLLDATLELMVEALEEAIIAA